MMMRDADVERRLRSMLTDRADAVDPAQVGERLVPAAMQARAPIRERSMRRVAAPLAAAAVVAGLAVAAALGLQPSHHTASPAGPVTRQAAPPAATVTYVHGALGGDVWIPADRSGTWQFTRSGLGKNDSDINEKVTCAAFSFFRTATAESKLGAGGAKRSSSHEHVPNCDQGDWTFYRPKFAASLPTDPAALLAVMRKASYQHNDVNTFVTGQGFIGTGEVEPAVVGNIVAALKMIPGVTVQQGVGNGAGATGQALSYTGQAKAGVTETWTVIVNNADQVIGTKLAYPGGGDHETFSYRQVDYLGDTN